MMPGIVGFCVVEKKLLGPAHTHDVAPIALPVKLNVLPAQIGFGEAIAITAVGGEEQGEEEAHQILRHEVPKKASKQLSSVLKTSKLWAGLTIALRSAMVMRGIRTPFVVSKISSMADEWGTAPVLFMPMF